jgi:hypothetical protein
MKKSHFYEEQFATFGSQLGNCQLPSFTDLWHSKSEERREATVLFEGVRIEKLALMHIPPNYDPVSARKLGLHPNDMYLTSCISRANF